MKPVPPDAPGVDNDLKDLLEAAVVKVMRQPGSVIYAFGAKWGPEKRKDKYFKFLPGNGIHDIHMNQGNSGQYKRDNGIYQDGALIVEYPGGKWRTFFFAFQSQTFKTDNGGNPVGGPAVPKSGGRAKKTTKARGSRRSGASSKGRSRHEGRPSAGRNRTTRESRRRAAAQTVRQARRRRLPCRRPCPP